MREIETNRNCAVHVCVGICATSRCFDHAMQGGNKETVQAVGRELEREGERNNMGGQKEE